MAVVVVVDRKLPVDVGVDHKVVVVDVVVDEKVDVVVDHKVVVVDVLVDEKVTVTVVVVRKCIFLAECWI